MYTLCLEPTPSSLEVVGDNFQGMTQEMSNNNNGERYNIIHTQKRIYVFLLHFFYFYLFVTFWLRIRCLIYPYRRLYSNFLNVKSLLYVYEHFIRVKSVCRIRFM